MFWKEDLQIEISSSWYVCWAFNLKSYTFIRIGVAVSHGRLSDSTELNRLTILLVIGIYWAPLWTQWHISVMATICDCGRGSLFILIKIQAKPKNYMKIDPNKENYSTILLVPFKRWIRKKKHVMIWHTFWWTYLFTHDSICLKIISIQNSSMFVLFLYLDTKSYASIAKTHQTSFYQKQFWQTSRTDNTPQLIIMDN